MALAYVISKEHGSLVGVLSAYSLDLALEPIAYYTGIWTWLEPYTLQVYWGSTVANALVWLGMCYIGIKLWESKNDVKTRSMFNKEIDYGK
ncbi:hypothetical protein ES703_124411 [subsurface metagenome]